MVALVQVSWPLAVNDVMTRSAPHPADPRLPLISNARIYLIRFEPLGLMTGISGAGPLASDF